MEWKHVIVLIVGAVVATIGGLHNVSGLLALGGTIVGGVLGVLVPNRHPPMMPHQALAAVPPPAVDMRPRHPL